MTETHAQAVDRIVREESAKFLDEQFGQLDLSGCPSALKPPTEEDQLPDPRFAPLHDRGAALGGAVLRREIEALAYDPAGSRSRQSGTTPRLPAASG